MMVSDMKDLIPFESLERLAPVLRSAAHPVRLRILDYLEQEDEPKTVTEIALAAGEPQANVSQHLRILKDQGILRCRRTSHFVYYSIDEPSVLLLLECIRHEGCCGLDKERITKRLLSHSAV